MAGLFFSAEKGEKGNKNRVFLLDKMAKTYYSFIGVITIGGVCLLRQFGCKKGRFFLYYGERKEENDSCEEAVF